MDRHTPSVPAALLCLLVLATGCVGVLTGSEPAVFVASPADVGEDAIAETDFEYEDSRTVWLNRTVEAAGQSREVRVRNHVALYRLAGGVGPDGSLNFGVFTAVSTPRAAVAGQALNPIGQMSHRQLVDQAASNTGEVRNVERVGSRTLTVLGTETEVVRFAGVVSRSGMEVPVYIEATKVEHGDDFVIAVGAYPQEADGVRPQVTTLFEGVEH